MSYKLDITFSNPEAGRVRAQINSGEFGIFAEAETAPDAAAKVVKAYLGMNPSAPEPQVTGTKVEREYPWQYSRSIIRQLVSTAANNGGRVRVEYEDANGHETTRVIRPTTITSGDLVVCYDELRAGPRSLSLYGIKAAQEVD